MIKCHAYLVSDSINIKSMRNDEKLREVRLIKDGDNRYVVFPYGAVICWGDGLLETVLSQIQTRLESPFEPQDRQLDEFEVAIDSNHSKLIFEDCIYLEKVDDLEIIAISHAIAQSLRLSHFEDSIVSSIQKIKHIPENLASIGKIQDSKKEISKMQGHLYLLKGKISFEHSILDKPEFFWEYPEYDHFYERTARYLEIEQRIHVLEKKIGTIDGILLLLSDELNHRHSSQLEWIIIILILIEVVFFFLQDIFKLF